MAVLYRGDPPVPADVTYRVRRTTDHEHLFRNDDGWHAAQRIAWGPERWKTHFRALAAAAGLVARFDCVDDSPWHTMTSRDDHLWEEEVVEIFLDPAGRGRDYLELEISPANAVCDLIVGSPWPELQGDLEWDLPGLRTQVKPWIAPEAGPAGWTVVALLPWDGILEASRTIGVPAPPASGARWQFNTFRIKRPGGPANPESDALYAAWSVPDGPSFHVPAAFRTMIFD
ncbi:MAG: carbohydrate-binding family 9-like protein [Vicinamibacterales bacterium]